MADLQNDPYEALTKKLMGGGGSATLENDPYEALTRKLMAKTPAPKSPAPKKTSGPDIFAPAPKPAPDKPLKTLGDVFDKEAKKRAAPPLVTRPKTLVEQMGGHHPEPKPDYSIAVQPTDPKNLPYTTADFAIAHSLGQSTVRTKDGKTMPYDKALGAWQDTKRPLPVADQNALDNPNVYYSNYGQTPVGGGLGQRPTESKLVTDPKFKERVTQFDKYGPQIEEVASMAQYFIPVIGEALFYADTAQALGSGDMSALVNLIPMGVGKAFEKLGGIKAVKELWAAHPDKVNAAIKDLSAHEQAATRSWLESRTGVKPPPEPKIIPRDIKKESPLGAYVRERNAGKTPEEAAQTANSKTDIKQHPDVYEAHYQDFKPRPPKKEFKVESPLSPEEQAMRDAFAQPAPKVKPKGKPKGQARTPKPVDPEVARQVEGQVTGRLDQVASDDPRLDPTSNTYNHDLATATYQHAFGRMPELEEYGDMTMDEHSKLKDAISQREHKTQETGSPFSRDELQSVRERATQQRKPEPDPWVPVKRVGPKGNLRPSPNPPRFVSLEGLSPELQSALVNHSEANFGESSQLYARKSKLAQWRSTGERPPAADLKRWKEFAFQDATEENTAQVGKGQTSQYDRVSLPKDHVLDFVKTHNFLIREENKAAAAARAGLVNEQELQEAIDWYTKPETQPDTIKANQRRANADARKAAVGAARNEARARSKGPVTLPDRVAAETERLTKERDTLKNHPATAKSPAAQKQLASLRQQISELKKGKGAAYDKVVKEHGRPAVAPKVEPPKSASTPKPDISEEAKSGSDKPAKVATFPVSESTRQIPKVVDSAGRELNSVEVGHLRDQRYVRTDNPNDVSGGVRYQKTVFQHNLSEVLPEGTKRVYHETDVAGAKGLLNRMEAGPRDHVGVWVSDDPALATGQGTKGVRIEFDPKRLNGFKQADKPGLGFVEQYGGGGSEYKFDKSVRGAAKAIEVRTQRQLNALAKEKWLASRFDFENPIKTEYGMRVERKGLFADGAAPNVESAPKTEIEGGTATPSSGATPLASKSDPKGYTFKTGEPTLSKSYQDAQDKIDALEDKHGWGESLDGHPLTVDFDAKRGKHPVTKDFGLVPKARFAGDADAAKLADLYAERDTYYVREREAAANSVPISDATKKGPVSEAFIRKMLGEMYDSSQGWQSAFGQWKMTAAEIADRVFSKMFSEANDKNLVDTRGVDVAEDLPRYAGEKGRALWNQMRSVLKDMGLDPNEMGHSSLGEPKKALMDVPEDFDLSAPKEKPTTKPTAEAPKQASLSEEHIGDTKGQMGLPGADNMGKPKDPVGAAKAELEASIQRLKDAAKPKEGGGTTRKGALNPSGKAPNIPGFTEEQVKALIGVGKSYLKLGAANFEEWVGKMRAAIKMHGKPGDLERLEAGDHLKTIWEEAGGKPDAAATTRPTATAPSAPKGKPKVTTGISQESLEREGSPIKPGHTMSDYELSQYGQAHVKEAPKLIADLKTTGRMPYGHEVAILVAHKAELVRKIETAYAKFGKNSVEYANAVQARERLSELIKGHSSAWSEIGRAHQGETDVFTGSYYKMEELYRNRSKKDFTPRQAKVAENFDKRIKTQDATVEDGVKKIDDMLGQKPGDTARIADEAEKKLKEITDQNVRRSAKLDELRKKKARIANDIRDNFKAAGGQLNNFSNIIYSGAKLAKSVVEYVGVLAQEGVTHLPDVVDRVRELLPHATDEDIHRMISGEGVEKADRVKSPEQEAVAGIKKQARQAVKTAEGLAGDDMARARSIWNHLKSNYIDPEPGRYKFKEMVDKTAEDLGLKPSEVLKALGANKSLKAVTNDTLKAMAIRRQALNAAKAWVDRQSESGAKRIWKWIGDMPQGVMTLGHGIVGMVTHAGTNMFDPLAWKNWGRSWMQSFKSTFSSAVHEDMMWDIEHDSDYYIAKRDGLAIDVDDDYIRYGKALEAIPVISKLAKAGNRSMDALKGFRLNQYKWGMSQVPKTLDQRVMSELMAKWANHSSGYSADFGNSWVGQAAKAAASELAFAPKLEASRWMRVFGDPIATAKGLFSKVPEEKWMAHFRLKRAARVAGVYMSLLVANDAMLSKLDPKDRVNFLDPTKADFLRMKWHGKTLDPTGAVLGPLRFMAAMLTGPGAEAGSNLLKTVGVDTGYKPKSTEGPVLESLRTSYQYVRGKLAPKWSIMVDLVTGKDYMGRPLPNAPHNAQVMGTIKGRDPYTWGEYGIEHGPIPFSGMIREIYDSMRAQGVPEVNVQAVLRGLPTLALEMLGGKVGGKAEDEPDWRANLGFTFTDTSKDQLKKLGYDPTKNLPKPGAKETPEQYRKRLKPFMHGFATAVNSLSKSKSFQKLNPEMKKEVLEEIRKEFAVPVKK